MGWKPIASMVLSAVSIGAQGIGMSCASSGAITAAKGGLVSRTLILAADIASSLGIVLALLAVTLAAMPWPEERPRGRVLVWCLAVVAMLMWLVLV
jgi:hypothetical protein